MRSVRSPKDLGKALLSGWSGPHLAVLLVCIAVVATTTWSLGAWSACGAGCSFDVALFDAIGTWIGGVALVAVGAGAGLVSRSRGDDQRLERALARARLCTLRYRTISKGSNPYDRVNLRFSNPLDEPVLHPSVYLTDGTYIAGDHVVAADPTKIWGPTLTFASLSIAKTHDEIEANTIVKAQVVPRVLFAFTVANERFVRLSTTVYHQAKVPDEYRFALEVRALQ